jgi:hypothetical protein
MMQQQQPQPFGSNPAGLQQHMMMGQPMQQMLPQQMFAQRPMVGLVYPPQQQIM